MKQLKLWVGCLLLLWGGSSCENDLPLYDTPDCWLNFEYLNNSGTVVYDSANITTAMRESSYSFVYVGADVMVDTVWFKVTTMGFPSDRDRPLALMQIMPGAEDTTTMAAVSGEHYAAFDSPEMAPYYKMPAGAVETRIPIVMKRAASLADGDVTLKFTFKENEHFKPGYVHMIERTLFISNMLAEPENWSSSGAGSFFGAYGPVKHQFLMDITGQKWDVPYLEELFEASDTDYFVFLGNEYRKKLNELNDERAAEGLDPLQEADGTLVEIPVIY
jgi:hypothetical protein